jgi:hypothetical protein
MRRRTRAGFALLEFVLVGALLGIFIGIYLRFMFPSGGGPRGEAEKRAAPAMSAVQGAFRRCVADCGLHGADLEIFARFGAWPLLGAEPPAGALEALDTEEFSTALAKLRGAGADGARWGGPYLAGGLAASATFETALEMPGQKTARESDGFLLSPRALPVLVDPWGEDNALIGTGAEGRAGLPATLAKEAARGAYFRFMIPAEPDGSARHPRQIALVCAGPNGRLDTAATDIDEVTKDLRARKDDVVLRLLPREMP